MVRLLCIWNFVCALHPRVLYSICSDFCVLKGTLPVCYNNHFPCLGKGSFSNLYFEKCDYFPDCTHHRDCAGMPHCLLSVK